MLLKDRVGLITGGARGIGKAIAESLCREGATSIIFDIIEDRALKAKEELAQKGYRVDYKLCDVSDYKAVNRCMDEVVEKYGRIDILVNNAAYSPKIDRNKPAWSEITPDEWNMVMKININGTFFCLQAAAKHMVRQKYGSIINISSIVRSMFSPNCGAHYITSKAGVDGLTRALAGELAPHNIRVNAVAPGRVATEMSEANHPHVNEEARKNIMIKRFAEPQEIADAVLFLASDKSAYIIGTTLDVSGGRGIL